MAHALPNPNTQGYSSRHRDGREKKPHAPLQVGDPVYFAVQDISGKPVRHGSVVLFVEGDRVLLASSPGVPNVKMIEVGAERFGMSWVKAAYLGRGHKSCQTALNLSQDAAWSLRAKLLVHAGEVNEQVVLSKRGTATNTSDNSSFTSGAQSPASAAFDFGDARPRDHEIRKMVEEALSATNVPPQQSSLPAKEANYPPSGYTVSTHEGSMSRPVRAPSSQAGFGNDPNFEKDLKNLILDAFDEGLQAFRNEQKNMDRWVALLQERVSKVTGHFLMSWGSRLEFEMDRRLNMYSDMVKSTCASLQAASPHPQDAQQVAPPASSMSSFAPASAPVGKFDASTNGIQRQNAASTDLPAKKEKQAADGTTAVETEPVIRREDKTHQEILRMVQDQRQNRRTFNLVTESVCACYTKDQACSKSLVSAVNGNSFNSLCIIMTLCFSIAIGFEVDSGVVAALDGKTPPAWIGSVVNIFNVWFIGEVLLRLAVDGHSFLFGRLWRWNVLEMFLAVVSLVDLFQGSGTAMFVRLLRFLRTAKFIRAVQSLKMFSDLRFILLQMLYSLGPLLSSLVLVFIVTYISAVACMQGATHYVTDISKTDQVALAVAEFYPDLLTAMYTLACSIFGGIDWREAAKPVWSFGALYGLGFLGFIVFSALGIFNAITSVFVEHTIAMKRMDREYALADDAIRLEQSIDAILDLLSDMDTDGTGVVAGQTLRKFLKEEHTVALLAMRGIDISDLSKLEDLLQEDSSGNVNLAAFVFGCLASQTVSRQPEMFNVFIALQKLDAAMQRIVLKQESDSQHMAKLLASMNSAPPKPTPTRIEDLGANGFVHDESAMSMQQRGPYDAFPHHLDAYAQPPGLKRFVADGPPCPSGSTEV